MKVYLAHNFAAREWLKWWVIPFLNSEGHTVTSRWITDDIHLDPNFRVQSAVTDLQDVESAGAIIFWAENYIDSIPGEGKYVELGYALRAGKIVIVIGEGRCVFYNLPNVRHAADVRDCLKYLITADKGYVEE